MEPAHGSRKPWTVADATDTEIAQTGVAEIEAVRRKTKKKTKKTKKAVRAVLAAQAAATEAAATATAAVVRLENELEGHSWYQLCWL